MTTLSKVPFEYQPPLRGDLLQLRPLRADDYDDLYGVARGPLIWEQHPAKDGHDEQVWTFLARPYWGGRYNRELKRLMLEHAFQFVWHVVFLIGPQNVRSQRAVEKIGGVRAGSRRDDSGLESYVYQITAPSLAQR